MFERQMQDAELRRLARVKGAPSRETPLVGEDIVAFFKQNVQKRQTKMGKIGEAWATLVPEMLQEHSCLESFTRGTLTVLVDSSSHLYDLKQLLLAGLEKQIVLACKSTGLKKIALKAGRWYEEAGGEKRIVFGK